MSDERKPIETWRESRPGLWSTPTSGPANRGTLVVNTTTGACAFYFNLEGDADAMRIAAEDVVARPDGSKDSTHPAAALRRLLAAAALRRLLAAEDRGRKLREGKPR